MCDDLGTEFSSDIDTSDTGDFSDDFDDVSTDDFSDDISEDDFTDDFEDVSDEGFSDDIEDISEDNFADDFDEASNGDFSDDIEDISEDDFTDDFDEVSDVDFSDDIENIPDDESVDDMQDVSDDIPEDEVADDMVDVSDDIPEDETVDDMVDVSDDLPENDFEDDMVDVSDDLPEDDFEDDMVDVSDDLPEDDFEDDMVDVSDDIPEDKVADDMVDVSEDIPEDEVADDMVDVSDDIPEDEMVDDMVDVLEDIPEDETADDMVDKPDNVSEDTSFNNSFDDKIPETEMSNIDTTDADSNYPNDTSLASMSDEELGNFTDWENAYASEIDNIKNDPTLSDLEKSELLQASYNDFVESNGNNYSDADIEDGGYAKVLTRDPDELLSVGNDLVNDRLEVLEDQYRDDGLSEEEIQNRLADDKLEIQQEFLNDAFPDQCVSPDVFNRFDNQNDLLSDAVADISPIRDIDNWLGDINPNFDEFDTNSPYCNNCGSCAYAVWKRLEGDNDICASADNIGYNDEMEALTGMEQVSMSPDEIENNLLAQGDGAHAIIGIDRAEGPGHWFNAACIDGKVVAIDGQSGEILDWPPDYGDVVNWEMSVKKG